MGLEKSYGQVDGDGLGEELLQKYGTHCTPKKKINKERKWTVRKVYRFVQWYRDGGENPISVHYVAMTRGYSLYT